MEVKMQAIKKMSKGPEKPYQISRIGKIRNLNLPKISHNIPQKGLIIIKILMPVLLILNMF